MTTATTRLSARSTLLTVLAGVAASAALTTLIALVAGALGVGAGFAPLGPGAYLTFAIAGTLAGIGGWVLITRRVPDSARLLRVLVPVLVALTLIPDVILLVSPFIPGATPGAVVALMLMHPVVAAVAVFAGQRISPAR